MLRMSEEVIKYEAETVQLGGFSREAIIQEFVANLDKKQATIRSYRTAVNRFFDYVQNSGKDISTLTRKDIIDFKNHLASEPNPKSALTISLYLAGVKQFYKWAESEKIYPNIANGISLPKNKEGFIKQHLTKEECLELFDFFRNPDNEKERKRLFPNSKQMRLRDFAMIYLMVWTGLRTIEVSRLDVGDIDIRAGSRILKVWGKGHDRKDDFVALPDDVYKYIAQYLETRPLAQPKDPLFISEGYGEGARRLTTRRIQQICKSGLRGIGLDDHAYSAHSLRHTTAVQILLNGGDMYDVFYTLRHVDPAVSQKYVESIKKEMKLKSGPSRFLKAISVDNLEQGGDA